MKPPLGMLVHTHKVMTILLSVLMLMGFSDLVFRDQPRGALLGPSAPSGVPPRLIPTHEVGKPYKHEHGQKYCHYFMRMDKHPKGWLHLYETPHGMICIYGKLMKYVMCPW